MVEYKGEINILKLLLKMDGINISTISRKCAITSGYVKKYVNMLEQEGIVKLHRFPRLTIVELNKESAKYNAIRTLWGEEES